MNILKTFVAIVFVIYKCNALTIINPNGPVPYRCMDCICDAASECDSDEVCVEDDACGIYRIKPEFWFDAGMPTIEGETPEMDDAFINCVIDKKCAEKTIQQYMDRNKKDCNNDGKIDCKDFYAMHIYGSNCNRTMHDNFVKRYNMCDKPNLKVTPTSTNKVLFLPNYDETCKNCICEAASGCNNLTKCENDYCGMYRLTKEIWEDAKRPVILGDDPDRRTAYEECALNQECSEITLREYFRKYGKDCDGNGVTDCIDYFMIYINGGKKCNRPVFKESDFDVVYNFQQCIGRNEKMEIL